MTDSVELGNVDLPALGDTVCMLACYPGDVNLQSIEGKIVRVPKDEGDSWAMKPHDRQETLFFTHFEGWLLRIAS